MINKEIFKKALGKAESKGFKLANLSFHFVDYPYEYILFNHDFAKAFWGKELEQSDIFDGYEEELGKRYVKYKLLPSWQYHLQQMVLEEEPLKYLERFL